MIHSIIQETSNIKKYIDCLDILKMVVEEDEDPTTNETLQVYQNRLYMQLSFLKGMLVEKLKEEENVEPQ